MNNDLSVRAEHARPAGPGRDGLALQVRRLSDAVRNDDLERAKAFHASLEEHPAARGNGRLAALLQGLAEPLAQDDLAAARRALQDLRVGPSDTGSGRPAEQPGGHDRDRMRAAMRNLMEALRADELEEAELAFAQLVELSDFNARMLDGPYGQLVANLGAALAARDPDSAETLFAALASKLEPGSAIDVEA